MENKIKAKSIFRVPILDMYYEFNSTKSTKCTIRWYNPITCNEQISVGIARCNPMDDYNTDTGMWIAEGRAKQKMFDTYRHCANKAVEQIKERFRNLRLHEAKHLQEIVDKL